MKQSWLMLKTIASFHPFYSSFIKENTNYITIDQSDKFNVLKYVVILITDWLLSNNTRWWKVLQPYYVWKNWIDYTKACWASRTSKTGLAVCWLTRFDHKFTAFWYAKNTMYLFPEKKLHITLLSAKNNSNSIVMFERV